VPGVGDINFLTNNTGIGQLESVNGNYSMTPTKKRTDKVGAMGVGNENLGPTKENFWGGEKNPA